MGKRHKNGTFTSGWPGGALSNAGVLHGHVGAMQEESCQQALTACLDCIRIEHQDERYRLKMRSITWSGGAPSSAGVLHRCIGAAQERSCQETVLVECKVVAASAQDNIWQEGRPLQCQDAPKVALTACLRPNLARLRPILHHAYHQILLEPSNLERCVAGN